VPTTIEALVIVALVLSPGYVFTQLARRVIAHIEESTDVRFLLTVITAGTAIHALIFPWTLWVLDYYLASDLRSHSWEAFGWAVVTIFVFPVGLGVLAGRLTLRRSVERVLDWAGLGYIDRMPSAWDYAIRQLRPNYVVIRLKDEQGTIGGVFANRSFGSLNPRRADIYLEEAWQLNEDGTFRQVIPDTLGVWVSQDEMAYVHFLRGQENEHDPRLRRAANREAAHSETGHGQARRPADRDSGAVSTAPGAALSDQIAPEAQAVRAETAPGQARRVRRRRRH
jgi:hypothetical protein